MERAAKMSAEAETIQQEIDALMNFPLPGRAKDSFATLKELRAEMATGREILKRSQSTKEFDEEYREYMKRLQMEVKKVEALLGIIELQKDLKRFVEAAQMLVVEDKKIASDLGRMRKHRFANTGV
ncbi:MAG: hypothetical protein V1716_05820 [Candidatus Uhrbacteria bacterium]